MVLKIKKNIEVTVTKEILKKLFLKEGDLLDCFVFEGGIHLLPFQLPPLSGAKDLPPVSCSDSPQVYVTMFRQFDICIGNEYIAINNKKAKELLAYLLLHNGVPFHKLSLAETLWPQSSPSKAMGNLYKVIRYLKTSSPVNLYFPIHSSRGKIQCNLSKIKCDFLLFEQYCSDPNDIACLKKASDLYQGPLLLEEYYEWTAEKEAYFEIIYTEIIEHLSECYKQAGNDSLAYYYRRKLNDIH